MSCDDLKIHWPEFLTGDLPPKAKAVVEAHIAGCAACAAELHRTTEMWTKLGVLAPEQPSPAVRDRFYTMLEAYKQGLEATEASPSAERPRARTIDLRGLVLLEAAVLPVRRRRGAPPRGSRLRDAPRPGRPVRLEARPARARSR